MRHTQSAPRPEKEDPETREKRKMRFLIESDSMQRLEHDTRKDLRRILKRDTQEQLKKKIKPLFEQTEEEQEK